MIEKYYVPAGNLPEPSGGFSKAGSEKEKWDMAAPFAVIDTETNWNDKVMSIGVVIADTKTRKKIDSVYYIITPEYKVGGMFSAELRPNENDARITSRKQALKEIREWLHGYDVQKLFAYNALFDMKHLPEYSEYEWYDIMRLAAYRQYNRAIPDSADCFKTGRLKRGYGVEEILKMLRQSIHYRETHNAVFDALDELEIMRLLGHEMEVYEIALISDKKAPAAKPQKGIMSRYLGSRKK